MNKLTKSLMLAPSILLLILTGCSSAPKSPDIAGNIRASLDQSGLKDVSVSQDRDKGVVTLGGHVPGDADKAQAESIAKSIAGAEVVADEIVVLPPGDQGMAKTVNSDLDDGIEKNLDAVLVQNKLNKMVTPKVKSGVVTLTGDVHSEVTRTRVERMARSVPNVQEVVNELQVKDQKATATP